MSERHGDPRFYALLEEIAELHSRKNHDYAKNGEPLSNFTRARELGVEPWRGVLVRMSDKWCRIEEIAKGKQPKNESMRDSLVDLAVYALIDVLLLEDSRRVLPQDTSITVTITPDGVTSSTCATTNAGAVESVEVQHGHGYGWVRSPESKMGCGCK